MLKIYRARSIVTSNPQHDVFEDGFLAVEGDTIRDVGPWKRRPKTSKAKVEDCSFGMITPGLYNLHTHLPMVLFRGIAEDQALEPWLFETILPLEGKYLTKDFVRAGSELALCESIRNGVVFFSDMYMFEETIAQVADRFGVRGNFCVGLSGLESPDFKNWKDCLEAMRKPLLKYRDHPRVRMGVGPHAVYTCSMEVLKAVASYAKELKVDGMIHLSETKTEFENSKKSFGHSPLSQMHQAGLLEIPHLILAHSVWMEDKDFEILKSRKNLTVALNTQCNAKLGSGIAPLARYRNESIRYTLGTDGAASNNNLDMFEELNFASKVHHLATGDLGGLPGAELFDSVTRRAAEAFGFEKTLGSLEPGKQADFIVVDLQKPHLTPFTHAYSHLIYSVRGADVHSTYVAGKALMKNRRLLVADESKIIAHAEKIWNKMRSSLT